MMKMQLYSAAHTIYPGPSFAAPASRVSVRDAYIHTRTRTHLQSELGLHDLCDV